MNYKPLKKKIKINSDKSREFASFVLQENDSHPHPKLHMEKIPKLKPNATLPQPPRLFPFFFSPSFNFYEVLNIGQHVRDLT